MKIYYPVFNLFKHTNLLFEPSGIFSVTLTNSADENFMKLSHDGSLFGTISSGFVILCFNTGQLYSGASLKL